MLQREIERGLLPDIFQRVEKAVLQPFKAQIACSPACYAAMMTSVMPEMQQIATGMPKPEDIAAVDMSGVMKLTMLFGAIAAALLAASVVRRLRDRGKSPLWALPPVVLTLISPLVFPTNLAGMLSLPGWVSFAMFAVTLTAQLSLIYLIVLLAGRSRLSA